MPADLRKIGSFSIYFLYSFVMKLEKNMTIHVSLSTLKVKSIINNWLTSPGLIRRRCHRNVRHLRRSS